MAHEQHFVSSGISNTRTSKVLYVPILAIFFVTNICCGVSIFVVVVVLFFPGLNLFCFVMWNYSLVLSIVRLINTLCTLFNGQEFFGLGALKWLSILYLCLTIRDSIIFWAPDFHLHFTSCLGLYSFCLQK